MPASSNPCCEPATGHTPHRYLLGSTVIARGHRALGFDGDHLVRPLARRSHARRIFSAGRLAGRLRVRRIRAEEGSETRSLFDLPAQFRIERARLKTIHVPPKGLKYAALYARFSTSKQKMASIEIQLKLARKRANALGLTIYKEYSEIARSGKNAEREVFNRMLADAAAGRFMTLIVYNVSRFSRTWRHSMEKFDLLQDHGVKVHTVNGELDEREMLEESVRAQRDHSEKLEGFQNGRIKSVEDNKVPLSPLFGHMIQLGKPGEHVRHPVHSVTVERIFDLLDQGVGASTVAAILTAEGRLTPGDAKREKKGDPNDPVRHLPWTTDMVQAVRRNPKYKGLIPYNTTQTVRNRNYERIGRTSNENDWVVGYRAELAIVDAAKFDRVQISDFKLYGVGARRAKRFYPLAGLVCCSVCGQRVQICRSPMTETTYHCGKIDPATRKPCPGIGGHPVATVDRVVLETLGEALRDGRRLADYVKKYDDELERVTLAGDARRAELVAKHAEKQLALKDIATLEIKSGRLPFGDPNRYPESVLGVMKQDAIKAERDAQGDLDAFERSSEDGELRDDLETLQQAFGDLALILEKIGENVDGGRLRIAIQRIVVRVSLSRPARDRGLVTIMTTIPKAPEPEEDWSVEWPHETLTTSWDVLAHREVRASENAEIRRIRLHDLAVGQAHAIDDKAFEIAKDIAETHNYNADGQDLRTVIDAMLFYKKAGCTWDELPTHFGDRKALALAYHRLIYNWTWDLILDAWDGAGLDEIYHPLCRRALEFPGAKRKPDPRRRTIVLKPDEIRAAKFGKPAHVQLRMEAVALLIEGCKQGDVARKLSISTGLAKAWRRYLYCLDVKDIDDQPQTRLLEADELEAIRKMVDEKRSQGDWQGMPSLMDLFEHCRGIGVHYRHKRTLASALYRAGIYISKKGKRKH